MIGQLLIHFIGGKAVLAETGSKRIRFGFPGGKQDVHRYIAAHVIHFAIRWVPGWGHQARKDVQEFQRHIESDIPD